MRLRQWPLDEWLSIAPAMEADRGSRMADGVKLSISGLLIRQPRRFTKEELATRQHDPEDAPDCIEILPDGRHVAEYSGDVWYEVDPVTNEVDFSKRVDAAVVFPP